MYDPVYDILHSEGLKSYNVEKIRAFVLKSSKSRAFRAELAESMYGYMKSGFLENAFLFSNAHNLAINSKFIKNHFDDHAITFMKKLVMNSSKLFLRCGRIEVVETEMEGSSWEQTKWNDGLYLFVKGLLKYESEIQKYIGVGPRELTDIKGIIADSAL